VFCFPALALGRKKPLIHSKLLSIQQVYIESYFAIQGVKSPKLYTFLRLYMVKSPLKLMLVNQSATICQQENDAAIES